MKYLASIILLLLSGKKITSIDEIDIVNILNSFSND
jgi:hypothetical protein